MKLVLITGATKGIGRSTSFDFANAGWDLILLARDLKLLEILKRELATTKSKVYLIKCDLSDSKTIDDCLSEVITQIGCPSVVINNAGFQDIKIDYSDSLGPFFKVSALVNPSFKPCFKNG